MLPEPPARQHAVALLRRVQREHRRPRPLGHRRHGRAPVARRAQCGEVGAAGARTSSAPMVAKSWSCSPMPVSTTTTSTPPSRRRSRRNAHSAPFVSSVPIRTTVVIVRRAPHRCRGRARDRAHGRGRGRAAPAPSASKNVDALLGVQLVLQRRGSPPRRRRRRASSSRPRWSCRPTVDDRHHLLAVASWLCSGTSCRLVGDPAEQHLVAADRGQPHARVDLVRATPFQLRNGEVTRTPRTAWTRRRARSHPARSPRRSRTTLPSRRGSPCPRPWRRARAAPVRA